MRQYVDTLHICRFVVFGVVLLFSLVELGLCANEIRITENGVFIDNGFEILMLSPFYFTFAAFGLATSVLTIAFMVPIIIVDLLRKGAFTSMIIVELVWTAVLWLLWLASAAESTAVGIFHVCNFEDGHLTTLCHQYPAIQGLAYFNWILLFGWWLTLLFLAIMMKRSTPDKTVWRKSIADADLSLARPSLNFRRSIAHSRSTSKSVQMNEYPPVQATGNTPVHDRFSSSKAMTGQSADTYPAAV